MYMQGGPCTASGSTALMCVLPSFSRQGSELKLTISYTVRFGAAPGPDLTMEELTLKVKPDPFFKEDGTALVSSTEFLPGVGGLLRISVS